MERVGVIGLGRMGRRMATHLVDSEYRTRVYDRSPEPMEPFRDQGVPTYGTPRELVDASDVIILMVSDGDAVLDVLEGDSGVLAALGDGEKVVINMSTIGADETLAVSDLVAEAGGAFVEAPVSGTTPQAENGTLTVLAAGPNDVFDEVQPILAVLGEPVFDCGSVGQGTRSKLFANLLLAGMVETFAEALAFGTSQGLELEHLLSIVSSGGMDTPLYSAKGAQVQDRDFTPRFSVDHLGKDLGLVLDAASEASVPLPVASTTRSVIDATRGLGHGDKDIIALLQFLEQNGGLTVGGSDE